MTRVLRRCVSLSLLGWMPAPLLAHSFSTPYVLPVPLWMYVYGCAATLLVTFALIGLGTGPPETYLPSQVRDAGHGVGSTHFVSRSSLSLVRVVSGGCLLLCILAGLIGSNDPEDNIAMTLFWVVFLLAFAYLTLLFGDLYAVMNPWQWAVEQLERLGLDLTTTRVTYPRLLGNWPAFFLYMALIWFELFAGTTPVVLSIVLLAYSVTAFIGIILLGKDVWFQHVDPFSVYFRIIGSLAPVQYYKSHAKGGWQVRLRRPFAGALEERPEHIAVVLFVLFMLSSTAYDSIRDTALWIGIFWKNLLSILQPLWGEDVAKAQSLLMGWYLIYRQAGLLIFPFLYFGCYLLALQWARSMTRASIPLRALALDFCYSLVPIALAYNFAHYYPFLEIQLRSLPRLLANPFGFGRNRVVIESISTVPALQMGVIWHLQVAAILVGHLVGIYLAHRIAAQIFVTRRQIIMSQLPLLLLMVVYTVFGLWILSLPLGATDV